MKRTSREEQLDKGTRKWQRMSGEAYCSSTKSADGEYIVKEPRVMHG